MNVTQPFKPTKKDRQLDAAWKAFDQAVYIEKQGETKHDFAARCTRAALKAWEAAK